jgi:lipoprotein-anchoring transpeptidase ErfK/SrfK
MLLFPSLRSALVLALLGTLAACGKPQVTQAPPPPSDPRYAEVFDGAELIPAVPQGYLVGQNPRIEVAYSGGEAPGSIVVDPHARVLYLVEDGGLALRYGIAVGREGRGFSGDATIRRKEEWPRWTPTANMIRTEPEVYGDYRAGLPGGLENPLGARALYLYRGNKDSHYRIHGTNNSSTIGRATSAGCIRLFNQDAIDLFNRVDLGARVHVRSLGESIAAEGEMVENEHGLMVPMDSLPPEVQDQIRAGFTPWPKFVPIIGVNATAPVRPDPITGELPAG